MANSRRREMIVKKAAITNQVKVGGVPLTVNATELNTLDGILASTAELNVLNGATATTQDLNALDGAPNGAPGFVIGAQAGDVINVAVQLNKADGNPAALRTNVFAYLSDDANGDSIAGTAPSGGWAIGTDGLLIPVVAGKAAQLISEADGDIDINITEAGADTWYLVIVHPSGKLSVSDAITFA